MKTTLGTFYLIVATCTAQTAPPSTLKSTNVTFRMPAAWHVQRAMTNGAAESLQLMIPDADTDETPDSSNAALTAEPVHGGLDVKTFGNSRLTPTDASFLTITDIPAGEHWRTVLSTGHQGETPYVIVDRFGVADGWMVALRVAFPVIGRTDTNWTDRTMSEINSLIASLKINGTNAVNSEIRQDKSMIWLRQADDEWRPTDETIKKATYRRYVGPSNQASQSAIGASAPRPER